jgi:carbohydrate-binding DOMON domain-containing protein
MPDNTRRSKMISLRLSTAEYEALRTLYPNYGARNISDFARLAIQRIIGNSVAADSGLLTIVQDLDLRMVRLEHQVAQLLGAPTKAATTS